MRPLTPTLLRAAIAVVAVVLWLAGNFAPAHAAETIESFDSVVVVARDGDLDVTETIRVRAEGDQIRRGIYRDFPLIFVDADGGRHRVSFDLVDVKRDGAPEPHHTVSNSDGIRIYAGEESTFLPTGSYTYQFHYRTGRQVRFLPDHAELFWNVTGNEWAFPILAATSRITLPDGAAPVRWTAYTGYFGERGASFKGEVLGNNSLEVTTTRTLGPREGLSVVVQSPEGLVAPPSGSQQLYYQFLDNRRFVLGGLGFLGVLAFYAITWNAVGRDPPQGIVIPLFHPPQGISPPLAAYVRDWGWSGGWRAFTAAALSLAVKGLLVFEDSGDELVLKRTGSAPPGGKDALPAGEQSLLSWVDDRGGEVKIDRSNGTSVAAAFAKFKKSVEGENRSRFFNRNVGYFLIGVLLTIATIVAVLVFGDLSDGEIGLLIGTAIVGTVVGAFVTPILRYLFGTRGPRSIVAVGLNIVVLLIVVFALVSLFGGAAQSLPDDFTRSALDLFLGNGFPFILVAGFAAMNGLFFYLLRAPTAAGRVVMDQIEGLELYIRTAETNRLNLAGAPDLTTTQFERILPYAVALNAEKPWSDAFATAFARAHPDEDLATGYQPGWHAHRGWSSDGFGSSIASAVSSAQGSFVSAIPPPQSSSSGFSSGGGGGGSGGGGGGGGGGGW